MNKKARFFPLLSLALFSATLLTTPSQAASLDEIRDRGTIRIAIANEIPYGYTDLEGEQRGAGPDVAKHIVEQLGIKKIEWITTNFGSLIPGLRADRFDVVAAEMAILPQRCDQVAFSEPNSSYGEGLLVAKGNPEDIHSYEYFTDSDAKVAIMAGADQLEMLQALNVPDDRMVTISANSDAISTVATGRAVAYAATSLTVSELAKKSKQVEPAKKCKDPVIDGQVVRSWGAFTFNQDASELVDAFDAELEKFKQTDEWREILTRYGFTEQDLEQSFKKTRQELCAS